MNSRIPGIGWFMLGLAVLAAMLLGLHQYGIRETVPGGVTIAGWKAAGLPIEQARKEMRDKSKRTEELKLLFAAVEPYTGEKAATLQETGFRVSTEKAEARLAELTAGHPFRRALTRWKLRGARLQPEAEIHRESFDAFVGKNWAETNRKQPVNAHRLVTLDDKVDIIPDISAYHVDAEALLGELRKLEWTRYWRVAGEEGQGAAGEEPVHQKTPVVEVPAAVTAAQLAEQKIERKISEFTTSILPGDPGRSHNIASAAKTVHDRLLKPGEVFDYAKVVEETERQFGFKEAPVIYNGKLVPGLGGGICQVSSTLYNAVLRAGLEIVERRNHSLPVSYVPLGQDATFSTGYINFRFRNNTSAHLLIRTFSNEEEITVKLFGSLPQELKYTIETVKVSELEAPVKYVKNPTLKPGRTQILQKGKPGAVVETYRVKHRNGVIASKELISKDHYQPQPTLIAQGSMGPGSSGADQGTDNGSHPPSNILEDGVGGPRF